MIDGPFAINVQSMLIVMLVSSVLMAAVLWFAFAGRFRDGLAKWTTSLWVQALAWLLFAGRGLVPDVLAVAAANGLLALTWALQFAAIIEFRRRRVAPWLLWAPPAAILVLFLALDDRQLQLAASGLLYGAANILIAVSVLRGRPRHILRARWLLAGCYTLAAVTLIVRGSGAWMEPEGLETALTANSYHGFLYLGTYALIVAGSFAFLLMHKERSDEETSRLATTDPLTGVFNRRTFIELAEQELARSRRAGTSLALMMLDLDHFKRVNDTYGHLTGDEVLVSFTRLIKDCVRRGDLVVRYGGEEFCVLLPGTSLSAATALAERIRATCAARELTAKSFRVTASIGLTAYAGGIDATLGDLLARADEALYRAKDEGRNRVIALPPGEGAATTQRILPLEQAG
ncbi:MAG: GGDEF domain-containing protein [Betaproteobacteria bacterium]|nr:GGDEF domain-containing protein [Betaproteobacteria bacterium]